MTYTHNPIGFVVLSSANPDYDVARWKAARPHSMTFTQNTFHLVKRCLDEIPELQVAILRTVGDNEKELHLTGAKGAEGMIDAFINLCEYEGLDRNRCYLQLWNEPNLNSERAEKLAWTVYAMQLARERGVRCSVLGIGMATLEREDWLSGDFDALLYELKDGYHILDIHAYGGPIVWAGAAGRLPDMYLDKNLAQQENAPSPYDVQIGSRPGNWYIGRVYDAFDQCDILGIDHPRVIVGECGPDRMKDLEGVELSTGQWVNIYDTLEQRYQREELHDGQFVTCKVPWPHWGMRGWNTLKWMWDDYYPNWSIARVNVEMNKWQVWVYDNLEPGGKPHVEAIQVFAHCPGMEDWDIAWGFDISKSDEWYGLVAEYADGIYNPPPGPSPDPDPDPPPEPTIPTMPPVVRWILTVIIILVSLVTLGSIIAPHSQAQGVLTMEVVQELLNVLYAIPALVPIAFTSSIVYFLVEAGKRLKDAYLPEDTLKWLTPQMMAFFWILVAMVSFGIAEAYAYDNVFKEVAEFITKLIEVVGPYALGTIGAQYAATKGYKAMRNRDVVGFNYDK